MRELLDLSLHLGELALVLPDDATIERLARRAANERVLLPDQRQWFTNGWSFLPEEEMVRSMLQYHWQSRGNFHRDRWTLPLVLLVDGEPVGGAGLMSARFPLMRQVETGSWVLAHLRGRRLGVRMRAMMLDLAFAYLDAEIATSDAHVDNAASNGVSRSLGYETNGIDRFLTDDGVVFDQQRWKLMREDHHPFGTQVKGFAACEHLFE